MTKDKLLTKDIVKVSVSKSSSKARYPCPKCGKETKKDHKPGTRICSNKQCRERVYTNN
jgi:ribosomal protein L37AE/L43A